MNEQLWWHLTRASANVAWVLIVLSILWGVLLATRVLKPNDRPAWLRDIHTWMGGLSVVFAGIHMVTLILDSYVTFTVTDILVPFASSWKPVPTAIGILAFWMLAAVQITSLMIKKMSRVAWRRVHMLSYLVFATSVVHALSAGSDVGTRLFTGFSMAVAMVGTAISCLRWVAGRAATRRRTVTATTDA